MQKTFGVIGVILSIIFIYICSTTLTAKTDYIRACTAISMDIASNLVKDCYNVYPEDYEDEWRSKLFLSFGALIFSVFLIFNQKEEKSGTSHL